MTQPNPNDPYDFDVSVGETITFHIKTFGTNPHITMAHGGDPLLPPYSFTIEKLAPHIHVVATEFVFDKDAAPDARYDIRVTGSTGGDFAVPTIDLNSAVDDPGFAFGVM